MTHSQNEVDRKNLLIEAVKQIDLLKVRYEELSKAHSEAIAIVGIGCRFPGGVDSAESFWQMLQEGRHPQSLVPPDRWDVEAYYHPDPSMPGKTVMRSGYFLENIDLFDAPFFQISPREAGRIDPQQRILLEVVWEALENASIAPSNLEGTQTGIYMGYILHDYASMLANKYYPETIDQYYATGNSTSTAIGRVSYLLGIHGPCIGIDTACSSSLVATHLACQGLRLKECDIALAGGVNIMFDPIVSVALSRGHMLAPDGRCKTFDASANGYARGEGCAVLVLKRLSDAVAQRDPIWAVIHGSAVNQDGPSSGLTVPNGKAQVTLIRQALNNAQVKPEQIQYVEAHGTGTSLGDPIEIRALGEALTMQRSSDNPLYVGSVKTNIGHLEAAAGVAGLVKVALALHYEELPPHLHFKQPSPQIPWDEFSIHVPTSRMAWPAGADNHFAGISSFGMGGTNAHIILGQTPKTEEKPTTDSSLERPYHILTLSAKTEAGLRSMAAKYDHFLSTHPESALTDICYTANTGRAHYSHRVAFITETLQHADAQLSAFSAGYSASGVRNGLVNRSKTRRIGFLFTGQGSQYPGMGRQLYDSEPTYKKAIDLCNDLLQPHLEQSLLSVLFPSPYGPFLMDETGYTQPVLFSLEYALAQMMLAWGIEAEFYIGHSLGEYVAACLAGVFSLEDALRLVTARGRLMQALPKDGSMAAILADEATVLEVIEPYQKWVSLAAVNTPSQVTISGRKTEVDIVLSRIAKIGINSVQLNVSHAFHSPLMEKVQPEFLSIARQTAFHQPDQGLISNVTGNQAGIEVAAPEYWTEHIRKPVLFAQGIHSMARLGCNIMVELGPHPTLINLGQACLSDANLSETSWLATLRRGKLAWPGLLQTLSDLYVQGCEINWKGFDSQYSRRRINIPTYAFQNQRYWPSAQEKEKQIPGQTPSISVTPVYGLHSEVVHPYLGRQVYTALETEKSTKIFENDLGKIELEFLQDGTCFPVAVWLEMALAAGKQAFGTPGILVENLTLSRSFVMDYERLTTNNSQEKLFFAQSLLQPEGENGTQRWSVYCIRDKKEKPQPQWQLQGQAYLLKSHFAYTGPSLDISQIKKIGESSGEEYYRRYSRLWIDTASDSQVVKRFGKIHNELMGEIMLEEEALLEARKFILEPSICNCAIQVAEIMASEAQPGRLYFLRKIARIEVYGEVVEKTVYFKGTPVDGKDAYDCTIFSKAGIPIARFVGMEFEMVPREEMFRAKQVSSEEMEWLNELISWRVDRR